MSYLKKENKRIERSNKKLKSEIYRLSNEITSRTQRLENAIQKAEESNRLKSLFLANMSHEIRTPLNGIMGFTELIVEDDVDKKTKELFALQIHQNSQNLLKLIDQIFHLSVIETGKISVNKEKFNVQSLIQSIEYDVLFKIKSSEKKIKLSINIENPEYIINTDKDKLKLILNNLFDNAIKFTDSGIIELTCLRMEKEYLFQLSDSGCGLKEDEFDLIFDPFMQGSETLRKIKGGPGLGLSNVKNYVILLGGKVWCEMNKPNGSIFSFTIPAPILKQKKLMKMLNYSLFQN